ncbi:RNA-binding S4 domain-containing protein [Thalassotalea sp. G2M2-11]|uniref:RNA-binding S4 domain-containing protein n=1 Tax=Thalassotalea sp. G2M2-11 TaxID=2787627 RepID=UPI0019D1A6AE|nr:RNA-binding S4 domain-containing protein [Thalassotalea sp. G2M2-11]
MSQTISVELDSQPIELCKLLKVANLVGGGGEAKVVISEGYVAVNGEIEYQKRKKIYNNDVIEFNSDFIEVICHAPVIETPIKKRQQPTAASPKKNVKSKTSEKSAAKVGRRKKISF